MQKGHILSVLQVTPELSAGGVERTTIEMAEAISRAGGLALVASAGGRLEPDLKAVGGELIRMPVNSKNPIIVTHNINRIARVAKDRGVQLIHARSRAPAWSAFAAARRLRLPFVTTYHGIYNARTPLKRLYNSVMARGDVVIANSEYTRQVVLRDYRLAPERVVTIPRGVDLDVFNRDRITPAALAAMRTKWNLAPYDTRLIVLMPARLTRWKGQLVLIDALAKLQIGHRNRVKAIIAGDPQGRSAYVRELRERIESSGLRETVAVVGHISQMATALAASDVAVFPPVEPEAFGRGAVEAQAMGVPVIAANLGGLAETTIDGETGILVPPNDSDALAAAIVWMLDMSADARAAMGLRGKNRARLNYAKTALQASTLQVYDRLLGVNA